MLNHGPELDKRVSDELVGYTLCSGLTHLFHAGRRSVVAYTVICLVMHDCTGGLSTRYPTADSMVDIGSTSASAE